jgi:hypothetical protein
LRRSRARAHHHDESRDKPIKCDDDACIKHRQHGAQRAVAPSRLGRLNSHAACMNSRARYILCLAYGCMRCQRQRFHRHGGRVRNPTSTGICCSTDADAYADTKPSSIIHVRVWCAAEQLLSLLSKVTMLLAAPESGLLATPAMPRMWRLRGRVVEIEGRTCRTCRGPRGSRTSLPRVAREERDDGEVRQRASRQWRTIVRRQARRQGGCLTRSNSHDSEAGKVPRKQISYVYCLHDDL